MTPPRPVLRMVAVEVGRVVPGYAPTRADLVEHLAGREDLLELLADVRAATQARADRERLRVRP